VGATVTHHNLIPTFSLGLHVAVAVIISLTDWVLDDFHRRTRLSEKPIFYRRCRSPIVLKIAVRTDADSRRNNAVSFAIGLLRKLSPTVHFLMSWQSKDRAKTNTGEKFGKRVLT